MEKAIMGNYAFIDGQNLYLATTKAARPWMVDLRRFRIYLEERYRVEKAYYFIGAYDPDNEGLYASLRENGYNLVFREHAIKLKGRKKGNVDVDLVFSVMQKLVEREEFGKVVLVSGDGDYKRMVSYLIDKGRFEKILLPDGGRASSLYRALDTRYYAALDDASVRRKIGRK